jgi:nucleosome assembly protein 1-like 1
MDLACCAQELTKKYELTDILDEKGPQLIDVTGTEIEWKEGKNLCVKEIKKKQKAKAGKNKGQIRQITKQVPTPSFFHYFAEPKSEDDDEEEKEENEEEDQQITLNEEEDYEIAHAIRTCIIPDAVLWFTGEAREDEDFEEDDEEGEEDGDEDQDDEEEEEEEEPAPKNKGKGKGGKGGLANASNTAGGGEQPECKQN